MKWTVLALNQEYEVEADTAYGARCRGAELLKKDTGVTFPIYSLQTMVRVRRHDDKRVKTDFNLPELNELDGQAVDKSEPEILEWVKTKEDFDIWWAIESGEERGLGFNLKKAEKALLHVKSEEKKAFLKERIRYLKNFLKKIEKKKKVLMEE